MLGMGRMRQFEEGAKPTRPACGGLELGVGVEDMFAAACEMPRGKSVSERAEVWTGAGRFTEINLVEFVFFLCDLMRVENGMAGSFARERSNVWTVWDAISTA
jgi:hypothetical protein